MSNSSLDARARTERSRGIHEVMGAPKPIIKAWINRAATTVFREAFQKACMKISQNYLG